MTNEKYILAGRLIDGSGGEVKKSVWLCVRDGKISGIKDSKIYTPCGSVEVVDMSHCTLMPPLVDCSVHLSQSAATDESIRKKTISVDCDVTASIIRQNVHYCHSHGVLGVADSGDEKGYVAQFKKEEEADSSINIKVSGQNLGEESSFLRLVYSQDIDEVLDANGCTPLYKKAELEKKIEESGQDISVVVANGNIAVREAIESGCGGIEQGFFMGQENLQIMASSGVLWIPTMLKVKVLMEGAAGDKRARLSKILENQIEQLRTAKKYGVRIALGTGAGGVGIIHGDSYVDEIKLFIHAGYSLIETLKCASLNGAVFFRMENLGLLQVGKPATFIASRGLVQQLPRKLSYLESIYVDGEPSTVYRKNPVKTVYQS